ncbi:MAG: type II toxin-antitoxin system PemK/MazF family toxin [Myxococcales bacterium]|nr:type II toxin-antitoxin system PemK/MazF family toxin [Myxococcales bacterium]MDP3505174.1 type II toxin-antitoxin system PemK/MazF family toxin [Myxococcales bacterium]
MNQYELWWADLPAPIGRRPVLLLSRNQAYRILKRVTVAEITTTIRNIPVEIELGPDEGLKRASVANVDNLHALAISRLSSKIGELSEERAWDVERALGYAFDIDRLKDP